MPAPDDLKRPAEGRAGRWVRRRRATAVGVSMLVVVALLGPRAEVVGDVVPVEPDWELEAWVEARESAVPGIRPGDGKEVLWADPVAPSHTELSVVYLHGFSADRHEISPVAEEVAAGLGANLFFTRLKGHGRDGAAMGEAEALDWLQDTEEALTVGSRLGSRVVLIGTSTGGTLAVWAAAQERWRDRLAAVVLVSPNFGPRAASAGVLLWPWGGVLARGVVGRERCFEAVNDLQERHWTTCYPTGALLQMMALVDHVRSLDGAAVQTPVLLVYSPDDEVVDAGVTESVFSRLGSPVKRTMVVAQSGDAAHHVLAGSIASPETTASVVSTVLEFVKGTHVEQR